MEEKNRYCQKKYGWKGKERNERKLKKGMKRNVMGREGNE